MAIHRPDLTDGDKRIVRFRPRTTANPSGASGRMNGAAKSGVTGDGTSSLQRDRSRPDDYRHRMATNVAALLFTALLTGAGIWLAMKLADLRNTQDCVLMGRRDCAHISSLKE